MHICVGVGVRSPLLFVTLQLKTPPGGYLGYGTIRIDCDKQKI